MLVKKHLKKESIS